MNISTSELNKIRHVENLEEYLAHSKHSINVRSLLYNLGHTPIGVCQPLVTHQVIYALLGNIPKNFHSNFQ